MKHTAILPPAGRSAPLGQILCNLPGGISDPAAGFSEGASVLFRIEGPWNLRTIGDVIDALVKIYDDALGDCDIESDGDDRDDDGDLKDCAWVEWTAQRGPRANCIMLGLEDDEEDDAPEEDDHPGQCTEDEISCGGQTRSWLTGIPGAGCEISDPGECEHDAADQPAVPMM